MKAVRTNVVLRAVKRHDWWVEKAPGVYGYIGWVYRVFLEQSRYLYPRCLPLTIVIFKNDFFYEYTPADSKLQIYHYLFKRVRKDKNFLRKLVVRSKRSAKQFYNAAAAMERKVEISSGPALWSLYEAVHRTYLDFLRYSVIPECTDVFSAQQIVGLLRRENPKLSNAAAVAVAIVMSAPAQLSFLERKELLMLEASITNYSFIAKSPTVTLQQLRTSAPNLIEQLRQLTRQYFWSENNYRRALILDENYFLKRVRQLVKGTSKKDLEREAEKLRTKMYRLKRDKRGYVRCYRFSKTLRLHFWILQQCAAWIDGRKALMTRANHYFERFCWAVAADQHVAFENVAYYTPSELEQLLVHHRRVPDGVITRRRNFSACVTTIGAGAQARETIFYGAAARAVHRALTNTNSDVRIAGQVACAAGGSIQGTVQVVLDVSKTRFKPGNILVTSMTRPEFIPLLRHAKAIITDEGGLTCHAAIVSRELGIPCIIGTRVATELLKDGDTIEMNTVDGTVRKVAS